MSPVLRRSLQPPLLLLLLLLCALFLTHSAADSKEKPRKKKDIRDYNDADMARLLEQWEVGPSGAFCASANAQLFYIIISTQDVFSHIITSLSLMLFGKGALLEVLDDCGY